MCPAAAALLLLHNPTHSTMKRRRARFSNGPPTVHVVEQLEQEEPSKVWYTRSEMHVIHQETRAIIRASRDNKHGSSDQGLASTRGLEMFISTNLRKEIDREQETLYDMVFAEQTLQKLKGSKDPSAIEEVSAMCSKWAKKRARASAAVDALEVSVSGDNMTNTGSKRKRAKTMGNLCFSDLNCMRSLSKKKPKVEMGTQHSKRFEQRLLKLCQHHDRDSDTTVICVPH